MNFRDHPFWFKLSNLFPGSTGVIHAFHIIYMIPKWFCLVMLRGLFAEFLEGEVIADDAPPPILLAAADVHAAAAAAADAPPLLPAPAVDLHGWSDIRKEHQRLRRSQASAVHLEKTVADLVGSRSRATIQTTFGTVDGTAQRAKSSLKHVDVDGVFVSLPGKTNQTVKRDAARCIVSHIGAQATQTAAVLHRAAVARDGYILSHISFDDASMWVSGTGENKRKLDNAAACGAVRIAKKRRRYGQNTLTPVLTINESLIVACRNGPEGSTTHGFSLCSPGQPLAEANYMSVFKRLVDWSSFGSLMDAVNKTRIDPGGEVALELKSQPANTWREISLVKDCLMLNNNIVCRVERQIAAVEGTDASTAQTTVVHFNCACHMTVLLLKPIMARIDGVSSFTVRVGHLFQASRPTERLLESLRHVFVSSWKYRKVARMPDDSGRWRAHAKTVMDLSSCSRDLDPDQITNILEMDNGDWQITTVIHWCLVGHCDCGGPSEAKEPT